MKVILAGYNIEARSVKEVEKVLGVELTPEVLSAAYARISRDPRNVDTLRREARREVAEARRSNETIVFDMGHSSIAEHAVFNFDVMNVSRLAVEEIEHFRLASFTEKSQRYIRLEKDYVVPREIRSTARKKEFKALVEKLTDAYKLLYEKLRAGGEKRGVAREDARYLLPLATAAQFGMTLNARELEYMISRLASHQLEELRTFSARLSRLARRKAPSLIRYSEPTEYFQDIPLIRKEIAGLGAPTAPGEYPEVRLAEFTRGGDIALVAGLIFSSGDWGYARAVKMAEKMGRGKRTALIARTMRNLKPHHGVWREFEKVRFLFELIVSSSCFAQLKRHRMATIITQEYTPSLGVTIPESVKRARAVGFFRRAVGEAESLYRKVKNSAGPAVAVYALTNAHRRRVLIDMNLRELYHFSRLRNDRHAQWDIRNISRKMCLLASQKIPGGTMMLGGKDDFSTSKKALDLKYKY
ncbi:MAG: FAD-dependent thymidylate synthase [Candidatus Krumholzibacteriota bacterium]|nr:FAD-dependent thymidylate synthase [Candidatus Krumholzibacteriota bacterium]